MSNYSKTQTQCKSITNANIHHTAILEGNITIDEGVEIGPYCILNGDIHLCKGVKLFGHVVISGNTFIGENTIIYSFSSIGSIPQDLKYNQEKSFTKIGKNNIIREHVTISSGTEHGGLYTIIEDNNVLMINSHVGHDCKIANNCIISNNVALAGHVEVQNHSIIGGNSAVHQFVRIGQYSMIGGMSGVSLDIPPFVLYTGIRSSTVDKLNIVGLKRHGFSYSEIKKIERFYSTKFNNYEEFKDIEAIINENKKSQNISAILNFIKFRKSRNICFWHEQ